MIDKIETNNPLLDTNTTKPRDIKGISPDNDTDVAIHVDYSNLLDKAKLNTLTDTEVIRRARELLLTGRLESYEIFKKAAENIVKYGI